MKFLRERFNARVPYHEAYINEGIKLDANENAYPIPKEIRVHMKAWVDEMAVSRYPDTDNTKLAEAIAKAYDVCAENVVCGVGSDELIDCILRSTIEEGDPIVAPNPSFSMYPQFTELSMGKLIQIPLKDDFSYDVSKLIEAVKVNQPKVIFLCNPNNPTGSLLSLEEIIQIIEAAEGLVVVDEAYSEFCDVTAIPLVKKYSNLVILKTFSKAFALAGARVGYGIADKDVIDLINTVKSPYNLNIFSQEIAAYAMAHRALYKPIIEKVIRQRTFLYEALKSLKIIAYPSYSNFIWAQMPDEAYTALREAKIYIKRMQYSHQVYYRITVGTEEENKALLAVLSDCLKA